MVDFQIREKEIFETLKKIKNLRLSVIGGYAVNAYTFPRFSIDCDIVVKNHEDSEEIGERLIQLGYNESKDISESPYHGNFKRYVKKISKDFAVSLDILIGEVLDRQTNATFSADWIFENSKIRTLKGKTIAEELKLRIINLDALFVMKIVSCRSTDIRDIFLLVANIKDKKWVISEISKRYSFENRLKRVKDEITSKQFKDGLQGVFGKIEDKIFEKHKKFILDLSLRK
jgi:hypothetical protein